MPFLLLGVEMNLLRKFAAAFGLLFAIVGAPAHSAQTRVAVAQFH
jgi:hypothetical protein